MKSMPFRSAITCVLLVWSLSAAAQKVKVESQGQAAVEAQTQAISALAMAKALGAPPQGQGQVVFFRSSTSPGAALDVSEGSASLGALPAGMYLVAAADPGMHAYAIGSTAVSVQVASGKTYYVHATNRAGHPRLLRSDAMAFQRAAATH